MMKKVEIRVLALEYGMLLIAREGIPIDHPIMLFTDRVSIRDVVPFSQPRPGE